MYCTPQKTILRALCVLCGVSFCTVANAQEKVTFDDHIKPIFRQHCLSCHDADGRSADLALDNYRDAIAGGASGEVLAAGDVGESRLWQLMAHADEPKMPPNGDKVPDDQLALVKAWIDGGLLENSGSTAMKRKKAAVASFVPSADNRPTGEPAMPGGFFREPVIHSERVGAVAELAASPWAPVIAVAGQRQVLLYHTDTRQLLAVVPFVVGSPEVIRFSRNGDLLLVAGGRGAAIGVVHLWDIKTGTRIAELGDEIDTILAADLSADHSLVALGGPRKRVKVLHTADGSIAYEITKHTDWVTAMEFSPDGQSLVTGDRSGGVHLWEAKTGRPLATLAGHKGPITSVSWRGDSQVVATASDDLTVHLWQADGTSIRQWNAHGGGVLDVAFNKAGQLVTSGRDKTAKLWNDDGKQVRQLTAMNDLALAIATTHNDALAIVADWTGEVRVVATETGEEAAKLTSNPPTLAMRLAMAEQNLPKAASQIGPAETALAGAAGEMESATKKIAEHNAQKQTSQQTLAQLQQTSGQCAAELKTQQAALAAVDKAIEAAVAARQPVESELKELETQLAAVNNQQGTDTDTDADAEKADQLTAAVAASKEKLAAADAALKTAKAAKEPARQAMAGAEAAAKEAAAKVAQEEKSLAEMEKQATQLPSVETLTAKREALKTELERKKAARLQAEKLVELLKVEQAAYLAASEQWTKQLAERQTKTDELSGQLAGVSEQLAGEQDNADAVMQEIDDLKSRIAAIKKSHQQLADIAGKTRAAAHEIEDAIATVAAEKSKIERSVADRKAAQDLQKP